MKGESRQIRPRRDIVSQDEAEAVALRVLGLLAGDPERLGRFLSLTGLDPATLRRVAAEPGFLAAVLDHVCGDEELLVALAGEAGLRPEDLAAAHGRLSPGAEEPA